MLEASTRLLGLRLGSGVTLLPSHLSKTSHGGHPDSREGTTPGHGCWGVVHGEPAFSSVLLLLYLTLQLLFLSLLCGILFCYQPSNAGVPQYLTSALLSSTCSPVTSLLSVFDLCYCCYC